MRLAEPAEMGAQARSLLLPAADAEVRVIALGEDPAVAARDDAQLERKPPVIGRAIHLRVGHVRLERDADDAVAAEPERAGGHPVDAVRADQNVGLDALRRPRRPPEPRGRSPSRPRGARPPPRPPSARGSGRAASAASCRRAGHRFLGRGTSRSAGAGRRPRRRARRRARWRTAGAAPRGPSRLRHTACRAESVRGRAGGRPRPHSASL